MARCFVIQPFDGGAFDARYREVFVPAIESAGLEAYRVDEDPNVLVPIDRIEEEIRNSSMCLADITTNNPNVWFELGYAIASKRKVILVCSKERVDRYPFDVQHRTVIQYDTRSPGDFKKLQESIAVKVEALCKVEDFQGALLESVPVENQLGLSPYETSILAYLLGERLTPTSTVYPLSIREALNRWGYTNAAFALGMETLLDIGYIEHETEHDYNDHAYDVVRLTSRGLSWLKQNRSLIKLREEPRPSAVPKADEYDPFSE